MKYISIFLALLFTAACAHVSTTTSSPTNSEKEKLLGSWIGELKTLGPTLTVVFRFEKTKDGEFAGFHDSPDQGGYGIPVNKTEMKDGTVNIKVSKLQASYKGKMEGDKIVGKFSQIGGSFPLTLKKGKYKAAYSINLPQKTRDQLLGKWNGKLGSLAIVFRFETKGKGNFVGYIDSPNQGARGIPITEATFTDGQLELKIKGVGGEYKGQLSGNSLSGKWTQMGRTNRLMLIKKN